MLAAAWLCAGNLMAQPDDGGGPGGPPPDGQGGPGGPGGGFGGPGGGFGGRGGGNFDPTQFQQMMMNQTRETLEITNDTEWTAIQPLIQKVRDAQRDVASVGGMGMRGFGGGGGGRGGPGGFGMQSSDEQQALQKAVDDNAAAPQIKDAMAKLRAARKVKQAQLEAAQAALELVLTTRQEAQAVLMGLLP
jgi:hypothetical protein